MASDRYDADPGPRRIRSAMAEADDRLHWDPAAVDNKQVPSIPMDEKASSEYRCLLISVFLLLLIFWVTLAVITYFFASQERTHLSNRAFCWPDVLSDLESFVNQSFDPCNNFYDYTCRKAVDQSLFSGLNSVFDQIQHKVYKNVTEKVFTGDVNSKVMVTLSSFHRSCLKLIASPDETARQANQAFHVFNRTWGVLSASPSDEDIAFLTILLSLTYMLPSIVSFRVEREMPPSTDLDELHRTSMYIRLSRSLPDIFGHHPGIYNYSLKIMLGWINGYLYKGRQSGHEVTVDDVMAAEHALALNSDTGSVSRELRATELVKLWLPLNASTVNKLFTRALPRPLKQLSSVVRIYATNYDAIKNVAWRLLAAPYRLVVLPLLLIHALVPTLSELFLFSFERWDGTRANHACGVLSYRVQSVWEIAVYELFHSNDADTDIIRIFESVRRAVVDNLSSCSNMEKPSCQEAVAKVLNVRAILPKDFARAYVELPTMEYNFFVNLLELLRYHEEVRIRHAISPEYMKLLDTQNFFSYANIYNVISITFFGLQRPLYYSNVDDFINLASVGVHLAAALFKAVGFSGRATDSKQRRRDWWTTRTAAAMEAQRDCFLSNYVAPNATSRFLGYYDTISAVTRALAVVWHLSKDKLADDTAIEPARWNVTRKQLFFIRFCQSWCSFWTAPTSDRWLCNIPARHLQDFGSAFGCPTDENVTGGGRCDDTGRGVNTVTKMAV